MAKAMKVKDTNPLGTLSMHQPWASLLVYGIKRIEGRDWPTSHRGKLWIHSTSREPSQEEIQEVESQYVNIYKAEGKLPAFPPSYPTGALLGTVDVVDCLSAEQVKEWAELPESVKEEIGTLHCWLCQAPKRLVVPQGMRGWPRIWQLPGKVAAPLERALRDAKGLVPFSWHSYEKRPCGVLRQS